MQQVLQILAQAMQTATQKGFVQTQYQLQSVLQQLTFLGAQENSALLIEIMRKVATDIQAKLNDNSPQGLNDAALNQEITAQMLTLNNTRLLMTEFDAQFQKLQDRNRDLIDAKKNEAIRLFNEQFNQLRLKARLNNDELKAFNARLREMLEKDFAVNNLPKLAKAQVPLQAAPQAKPTDNLLKGFEGLMGAVNSDDKDQMRDAARTFGGSIIGMIVEMIASICVRFAPSIAPLVGNLAKAAKGAFSKWFDVPMQDSGLFTGQNQQETQNSEPAPVAARPAPTPRPANALPFVQVPAHTPAVEQFMQNSQPMVDGYLNSLKGALPTLASLVAQAVMPSKGNGKRP